VLVGVGVVVVVLVVVVVVVVVLGLAVVVVVGPEQLFKQSASVANCPSPGFVCIQP